jgi:hypothetical protein
MNRGDNRAMQIDAARIDEAMTRLNALLSHAWMVRNFLKHADEVEDDEDLLDVHRTIFDVIRAVEGSYQRRDAKEYFRRVQGKLPKLKKAAATLTREFRRVSSHTNFEMAALSLSTCTLQIEEILQMVAPLLRSLPADANESSADDPSP